MTRWLCFAMSLVLVVAAGWPSRAAAQNRPVPGSNVQGPTGIPSAPGTPAPSAAPLTPDTPSPSASPPSTPATPNLGAPRPLSTEYVIGPGDVLQVSVWKNETLSRVAPVRPDGKISMPLLHDIQAAGLTAMQLRDKIATALAEFLPNPEASVTTAEVHSMRVSVLGQVLTPGVLELRGRTTILEAIAMAGGFAVVASPSKITAIRTEENGQTKRLGLQLQPSGDQRVRRAKYVLRPGNVIIVP
jgi:polysaccharide export outer membrane protein